LKLPQSVVSGSSCRIITMTFCLDFSGNFVADIANNTEKNCSSLIILLV
jgi:hypothetical protein